MKNKLLVFLLIIFLMLDIGLLYYYIDQKNSLPIPQIIQQKLNEFLPNISISKFTFDKSAVTQRQITGQLTLTNLDNASLSHLTLAIELEQGKPNGTLALIHRHIYNKNISLKPNDIQRISFNYMLPDSLSSDGIYFLSPTILNQTGIAVTRTTETLNGIIGENKMLDIDWRDSKIIHEGQEKNPLEGPIFQPKNAPQISLVVKNPHIFSIKATPHFVIYPRSYVVDENPVAEYQENQIEFSPESEQKLIFTLPSYEKAESFLADLTFIDTAGKQVSGISEFRWVIGGAGGKILALKIGQAEDFFGKVDTSITASVIGPPDALTVKNATIRLKLFSDDAKKNLLGTFSQNLDINAQPKNVIFPITFSSGFLSSPQIEVSAELTANNQNMTLHTVKEKIPLVIDRSRQQRTLYAISIVFILSILIVVFLFILRRKKYPPSLIRTFFLFFLFFHLLFFLLLQYPSSTFALTMNGGPDSGTGTCTKDPSPACNSQNPPSYYFTVSLSDEARLNESGSVTASGNVVISVCSNGVASYVDPTISNQNSGAISWGTPFTGAQNFIVQGTPRLLELQNVTITQYARASTPLCFQNCTSAIFTRTLGVIIKQPYYFCNEGNEHKCEAFGSFYSSEIECESINPGEQCFVDGPTCQNYCDKQEPPLPPLPSPSPGASEEFQTCYRICEPSGRTPNGTCSGQICQSIDEPAPLSCATNNICRSFSPEVPPPEINPEPEQQPKYNVCAVHKDPLGTRFACDLSSSPGLSCIPGGDTCSSGWGNWTATGPSCGISIEERSCSCVGPCCSLAPTALTCDADQDGPSAHCGDTPQTRDACFSQRPNNTPDITSVTQPTAVLGSTKHDGGSVIQSLDVAVFWKFQEGQSECNKPWGFAQTDQSCGNSLQQNKFVVKIFTAFGTPTLIETKDLIPPTGQTGNKNYSLNTTNQKIKTAGSYTVDVCAHNGYGERCYSEAHNGSRFSFTKVKIPAGTIQGDLIEHYNYVLPGGGYCAAPGVSTLVQLQLIRQHTNTLGLPSSLDCQTSGLVKVDGLSKITNYTCSVDYDNITVDIPTIDNYQGSIDYLNQTFSLQLKQPVAGYSEYYCPRNPDNNPFCNNNNLNANDKCTNNNSIEFVATGLPPKNEFDQNENPHYTATTAQKINVLFDIPNSGANAENYYKIKNAQFRSLAGIYSPFPANPLPYDSDDTGGDWLLTGQQGSPLISPFDSSVVTLGSGISNGTRQTNALLDISFKKWENKNYSSIFNFTPTSFVELVKSRKKSTSLTTPPASYNDPNINIYILNTASDVTISDNQISQDKIIIINGANLILTPNDSGKFNSSGKSVFFMSTHTVRFDPTVDQANGVFMGQAVDLGDSDATNPPLPLKIKGNLISVNPINTDPLSRKRLDNQKPSLFVVFDAKPYMDLLPLLSTTTYRWSELVP